MSPCEQEEFIAALQGKNYIYLKFKNEYTPGTLIPIISNKSEWMTKEESKKHIYYYDRKWRLYSYNDAKFWGYI